MRKTSKKLMGIVNEQLSEKGSSVRVLSYIVDSATLSTGVILDRNGFLKLRKRCVSEFVDGDLLDRLYGNECQIREIATKELKKKISTMGGKAVLSNPVYRKNFFDASKKSFDLRKSQGLRVFYKKGHVPWNKGKTKKDNASLQKLSEDRSGKGNPSYGKVYSPEEREHTSIKMKDAIFTGRFTPNTMNSLTSKSIIYNGTKYRSSWEVLFSAHNPEYEYETLRIRYEYLGKSRVYLVDFVCHAKKKVFEVKPKCKMHEAKNMAKSAALLEWCKINGYELGFITETEISALVKITSSEVIETFSEHTRNNLMRL